MGAPGGCAEAPRPHPQVKVRRAGSQQAAERPPASPQRRRARTAPVCAARMARPAPSRGAEGQRTVPASVTQLCFPAFLLEQAFLSLKTSLRRRFLGHKPRVRAALSEHARPEPSALRWGCRSSAPTPSVVCGPLASQQHEARPASHLLPPRRLPSPRHPVTHGRAQNIPRVSCTLPSGGATQGYLLQGLVGVVIVQTFHLRGHTSTGSGNLS